MAAEWIRTTIGEQATLQRGMDITKTDQRDGRIPVISSGGVSSFHDVPAATGPGVVLGRKGVVGSVWFVPSDYWPHDTTLWVKDFHGNNCRFVYYFFKWMAPRLATMDVGSANPTLNRNHVHPIEIHWPPVSEQRAIASILGAMDDKIELNRRMSETLEEMARALFKSWFVDFDPVRSNAEGRDPGLPKPVADLFPNSWEDSEHGKIPAGWTRAPLRDWSDSLSGGTPAKEDTRYWNGDIPWISPKVMTSIHADKAEAFVTRDAIGNGTRLAPAGATLVMVRGMGLHERVRVSQARCDLAFNQDVKALVPREIEPSLLLFAILHAQDQLLRHVESSGHGTGRLPASPLIALQVVMPPLPSRSRLAAVFDSFNERIVSTRMERRLSMILRHRRGAFSEAPWCAPLVAVG